MIASPASLQKIQAFLQDKGIALHLVDSELQGFIPGVRMLDGELHVGTNATVDGVLHEAGHLAITPKPFRHLMTGNLSRGQREMVDTLTRADADIEGALSRHAMQCSDTEATAWAFAAGRALGFSDEEVILSSSYDGEGDTIRLALSMGQYLGVNGMAAAGMCAHGLLARARGLPSYPEMLNWVQDGPYPEWNLTPATPARRMRP